MIFSYQISLPLLFVCLSGVVLFSFCDDHLFGGSRCGCSVKGASWGWRAIVLVLRRRYSVGALAVVSLKYKVY